MLTNWLRYQFPLAFFPADGSRVMGICDVQVLVEERSYGATVVLSERKDNPGRSVTNAVEEIAALVRHAILKPLGVNPDKVRWVEHYAANAARPETWDEVTFARYDQEREMYYTPAWRHIARPAELDEETAR